MTHRTPEPQNGNRALGIALRAARERLGETQKQFATRVRVTQPTISRWEDIGPVGSMGQAFVEKIIADIDRVHPINTKGQAR